MCGTCEVPGGERFPNPVSELLQIVLSRSISAVAEIEPSRNDLFELLTFAVRLRREFLQHELKTWDLLQTVL